jgi:hypothetical protein
MQAKKSIIIMTLLIAVLSVISSSVGIFTSEIVNISEFTSVNQQVVELYARGIYFRDSVSIALQGIASDYVTLFLAIPWLLVSLVYYQKGSFIGKIMLTGLSGYFLYTYTSYTFLWMYNPLFLIYVALMSLSLFNTVILFSSFDLKYLLKNHFQQFPRKRVAYFEIVIGVMIAMLWLQMIITGLVNNAVPVEVEHYTTLVIQGMDLGLLLPLSIVSGILLLKKVEIGYLLSFVLLVKSVMMLLAINAMSINQLINGLEVDLATLVIFGLATIFAVGLLIEVLLREKQVQLTNS